MLEVLDKFAGEPIQSLESALKVSHVQTATGKQSNIFCLSFISIDIKLLDVLGVPLFPLPALMMSTVIGDHKSKL